jgi:transposase
MKAYPVELRERVAEAIDGGASWKATAERFRVSVPFIGKLLKQRRETGSIKPRRGWTGSPPALDARAIERLRKAVAERPDATLDELRRRARLSCSLPTVFRYLRRLGVSRKKSRSRRANAIATM